ncbi:polysaccharide biosynthesis C-terminal domain-containing protein [Aquirufa nivalisilvae]
MKRVGITGQSGFIGTHLYHVLGLYPEKFEVIPFEDSFFEEPNLLDGFVANCDSIVHLAAVNRHSDPEFLFKTNIRLVDSLIDSLDRTNSRAQVLMSSSIQEVHDNLYGNSKKIGREKFVNWAKRTGGLFVGLLIPNIFGPFGLPNYNSFISTFCYKLTHQEEPNILQDASVDLLYVGDLVKEIINHIEEESNIELFEVVTNHRFNVSDILNRLIKFKEIYFDKGTIPVLGSSFDIQLFNTFRSYIDYSNYYPRKYVQHTDERGTFSEIIKLETGGQVSFSTTFPQITRGNHFHTRKIERFSVIKGKALIQLRKIGSNDVLDFYLDGDEPAFIDIPIWYTHNIKNIGNELLITIFWINESYNPNDADTYFEKV